MWEHWVSDDLSAIFCGANGAVKRGSPASPGIYHLVIVSYIIKMTFIDMTDIQKEMTEVMGMYRNFHNLIAEEEMYDSLDMYNAYQRELLVVFV